MVQTDSYVTEIAMPDPLTVAGAVGARLGWQNFNKFLSKHGYDDIVGRLTRRKSVPVSAMTISLNTFGFLSPFPPSSDITNLHLVLKASETLSLKRVTVLFNRTGGNGSYEIAAYSPSRAMHQGEEIRLTVLHYRKNVSAFWGEENPNTRPLKDIDEVNWSDHTRRVIGHHGAYYCEVVAMHSKGEERKNFTMLNPHAPEKLAIVNPSDHQDYDPDRQIPATGFFFT